MKKDDEIVSFKINKEVVTIPQPIAEKISKMLYGLVHNLGYPYIKIEDKKEISEGLEKIIKALTNQKS